jgi:putative membrane protein
LLHDALLAIAHHLAVFSIAAILFAEWALLRPGLTPRQLDLAGKLDRAYGGAAMLAIVVGFARASTGAKGWAFYAGNPVFWAKIAVFVAIGLMSAVPTIAMVRWRRAGMPSEGELRRVRPWLNAQVALLPLIPALAALMARGIGH